MSTPVFNFINRQQVYVEGVKNWYAQDFNRYLKLVADAVNEFLRKLGIKTLGDLPKSKLTALMKRINRRVGEVFSGYSEEFQSELKRFAFADSRVQKTVWQSLIPKVEFGVPTGSSIWAKAKDSVVAAFGKTVPDQLTDFVNVAKDKIIRRVNTGYANNEEVNDVADQITNLTTRTFSSVLQQIRNTARANIVTMFQHVTAAVTDTFGGLAFDCYQWISVMDSKTTELCRGLNGRIFRRGEGPLPPAHNYCRSRTYPVDCGDDNPKTVPTFFAWLLTQSKDFITDAFGVSIGKKFANGTLKQGDLPDWQALAPLDVDAFETKTVYLTA